MSTDSPPPLTPPERSLIEAIRTYSVSVGATPPTAETKARQPFIEQVALFALAIDACAIFLLFDLSLDSAVAKLVAAVVPTITGVTVVKYFESVREILDAIVRPRWVQLASILSAFVLTPLYFVPVPLRVDIESGSQVLIDGKRAEFDEKSREQTIRLVGLLPHTVSVLDSAGGAAVTAQLDLERADMWRALLRRGDAQSLTPSYRIEVYRDTLSDSLDIHGWMPPIHRRALTKSTSARMVADSPTIARIRFSKGVRHLFVKLPQGLFCFTRYTKNGPQSDTTTVGNDMPVGAVSFDPPISTPCDPARPVSP